MTMPFVHKRVDQTGAELWYRDYKDPLEPSPGGYGFLGTLGYDDAGRPGCHYCGKTFESLAGHVRAHGLTARQYKTEIGLLQQTALVSERIRVIHSDRQRRLVATGVIAERFAAYDALKTHCAQGHEFSPANTGTRPTGRYCRRCHHESERHRGRGRTNSQHTPERLNKTGRCYVQMLNTARTLAAAGRLTKKDLSAAGIGEGTIRRYVGSIVNLRMQLGVPLPGDEGHQGGYTDGQLLDALRSVAVDLGRTPSVSDLHRLGLPKEETFARHFGSYRLACVAAGLDPNLPGSPGKADDVTILVAYNAHANITKAARQCGVGPYRVMAVLARWGCPQIKNRNDSSERRAWAGEMARRLAGWPTEAVA